MNPMRNRLFVAQHRAQSSSSNRSIIRVGQWPAIWLLLASLLVGCGTMEVTPLKTRSADTYANTAQKNGVTIGVQPLTDRREVKETFKVNLLEKGLLPILLVAENHSTSSTFILAKEKVFVLNEATGATNTSQREKMASEAVGNAGTAIGVATMSLPLVLASLKMASDATVIQHNLADKELYSRTLGPGQRAHGFIYFHYPKGTALSGGYHVVVELKDSSTGETTPFDFKVSLTQAKP
jgi:hypothetical protein